MTDRAVPAVPAEPAPRVCSEAGCVPFDHRCGAPAPLAETREAAAKREALTLALATRCDCGFHPTVHLPSCPAYPYAPAAPTEGRDLRMCNWREDPHLGLPAQTHGEFCADPTPPAETACPDWCSGAENGGRHLWDCPANPDPEGTPRAMAAPLAETREAAALARVEALAERLDREGFPLQARAIRKAAALSAPPAPTEGQTP